VRNITGRPAEEWARTKVEAEHRMPAQAPCIEVARALQAQPSVLEAQARMRNRCSTLPASRHRSNWRDSNWRR